MLRVGLRLIEHFHDIKAFLRFQGPTEAEKKIEELTRQLEEQMETQEVAVGGEYFGVAAYIHYMFIVDNNYLLIPFLYLRLFFFSFCHV